MQYNKQSHDVLSHISLHYMRDRKIVKVYADLSRKRICLLTHSTDLSRKGEARLQLKSPGRLCYLESPECKNNPLAL